MSHYELTQDELEQLFGADAAETAAAGAPAAVPPVAVMRIVLRSGVELLVDVVPDGEPDDDHVRVVEDDAQQLASLAWDAPPGARRVLKYLDPASVDAVVIIRAQEPDRA